MGNRKEIVGLFIKEEKDVPQKTVGHRRARSFLQRILTSLSPSFLPYEEDLQLIDSGKENDLQFLGVGEEENLQFLGVGEEENLQLLYPLRGRSYLQLLHPGDEGILLLLYGKEQLVVQFIYMEEAPL